ncbi:MAG: glycoside hydrolase family 97 N-terminal domain-containing protein, partial [Prevotella sp.]|nr:glycoside hydrolase family 97 N-terminal domain-containing protein [Prevotella sp.]
MPSLATAQENAIMMKSPDGQLKMNFTLTDGVPRYSLHRADRPVILPSRLGYKLVQDEHLNMGFELIGTETDTFDETWQPVWGEEAEIRNHYNELLVKLQQPLPQNSKANVMFIRFRLYNDGLGFRYEFPMENALTYFMIQEELTEFALTGDHLAWWIPGDYSTQEFTPTESRLSEIHLHSAAPRRNGGHPNTAFSPAGVQTALQMKTDDGLYINIHEAAVLDYPTTNLDLTEKFTFTTHLTPDAEGVKGRMQTPCKSPWRTVMVCATATDVLASRLILNLNEPCALDDT